MQSICRLIATGLLVAGPAQARLPPDRMVKNGLRATMRIGF